MGDHQDLFGRLCSYENLELAYSKARKRKTQKHYVIEFEKNLKQNLMGLRNELILHSYRPKPLKTFIVRDPKTRKISKSNFRDRVVHHALCNVIEPIFEKSFIYDSFANRKGKGPLKALQRFDYFKRKISKNNSRSCFVLKCDIKHYFQTVNHNTLLNIIKKKVKDSRIIWLIKTILKNHKIGRGGVAGFGMPLGNLTSQFFANVYLDELDQYAKHILKAKYYIRYVDDFAILHHSGSVLKECKNKIDRFLRENLDIELHPDKSHIIKLDNGVGLLGFRIFFHHKLIRKSNMGKFERRFNDMKKLYENGIIGREKAVDSLEGWLAYAEHANTHKYRKHLIMMFNQCFPLNPKAQVINKRKHENFIKRTELSRFPFSSQKTLHLFKKGSSIRKITEQRGIKESTVWEHLAKLIEYNQLSVWKVLPKEKIGKILSSIRSPNDTLKDIRKRIEDESIAFDDIACVLAHVKQKILNIQTHPCSRNNAA